jgi:hypothetical protein
MLVVFCPFAAGYYLSYFYRYVNAVIAKDLVQDFGLAPGDLFALGFLAPRHAARALPGELPGAAGLVVCALARRRSRLQSRNGSHLAAHGKAGKALGAFCKRAAKYSTGHADRRDR